MKLSETQRWFLESLEKHRDTFKIHHGYESSKKTLRDRQLVQRRKHSRSLWTWAITDAGVAALREAGVPAPEKKTIEKASIAMLNERDEHEMQEDLKRRATWYFTRIGWHVAVAALESYRFDWSFLCGAYEDLRDDLRTKELQAVVETLGAFMESRKPSSPEQHDREGRANRIESRVVPSYKAALAAIVRRPDEPWKIIGHNEKRATIRGIEAEARLVSRGRWSIHFSDRGGIACKTVYCERVAQVDATARAAVDAYLLSEAQKP